jgi:hypothetical protein
MYQNYILVGPSAAVFFTILRYREQGSAYTGLTSTLEAAALGFSTAGCLMGGRSVRARFLALGSDKSVARADPNYMRERMELQISLLPAITAVAVLLAARYQIDLMLTWLAVPVPLYVALLVVNRLTGWSNKL